MTPRYKDAEREKATGETRQRLLQAAAEEFARRGYARANINSISQAAGFAKGTIYNYFPSKRQLLLALLEETAATHLAAVVEAVQDEADPGQRLALFFEAGFAFVARHPARGRAMIHVIYGPDDDLRLHLFGLYQPMFRLVAEDILAPGMAQGIFQPVDAQDTATLLMTIYLGTASQVDQEGRAWLDAGQVADFALRALRTESGVVGEERAAQEEGDHAS